MPRRRINYSPGDLQRSCPLKTTCLRRTTGPLNCSNWDTKTSCRVVFIHTRRLSLTNWPASCTIPTIEVVRTPPFAFSFSLLYAYRFSCSIAFAVHFNRSSSSTRIKLSMDRITRTRTTRGQATTDLS